MATDSFQYWCDLWRFALHQRSNRRQSSAKMRILRPTFALAGHREVGSWRGLVHPDYQSYGSLGNFVEALEI